MTNEEASIIVGNIPINGDECYTIPEYQQAKAMAIEALEQQPCEDWYDVPSNEMTLEQARQAVKDLRKKLAEYLEQKEKSEYEHDHDVVKAYNDGQAYILDKIRAEVEILGKDYLGCPQPQVVCDDVIKIIDKYRGE